MPSERAMLPVKRVVVGPRNLGPRIDKVWPRFGAATVSGGSGQLPRLPIPEKMSTRPLLLKISATRSGDTV